MVPAGGFLPAVTAVVDDPDAVDALMALAQSEHTSSRALRPRRTR